MKYKKEDWIQAGFELLENQGFQNVKIEVVAHKLGVSKGGFYGYFSNRDDFLQSILRYWEDKNSTQVVKVIDDAKGDHEYKLQKLLYIIDEVWIDAGELSVSNWARFDPRVNLVLMRVVKRRLDWCKVLFVEGGFPTEEAEKRATILHHYMMGCKSFRPLLPDAGSPERQEQLDHFLKQLLHQ